jgi:hypothetical protein
MPPRNAKAKDAVYVQFVPMSVMYDERTKRLTVTAGASEWQNYHDKITRMDSQSARSWKEAGVHIDEELTARPGRRTQAVQKCDGCGTEKNVIREGVGVIVMTMPTKTDAHNFLETFGPHIQFLFQPLRGAARMDPSENHDLF